jgi:hypothetical protein
MQSPVAAFPVRSAPDAAAIGKASGYGCIFRLRPDAVDPSALPSSARTALAAADAVLYDRGVDSRILALARQNAFLEPVAGSDDLAAATIAIARVRKLASEGWRVVWLVRADLDQLSAAIDGASGCADLHICTDLCTHAEQALFALARGPQTLASAFNGLAG